jgi:hypothetical protein
MRLCSAGYPHVGYLRLHIFWGRDSKTVQNAPGDPVIAQANSFRLPPPKTCNRV